MLIVEELTAHDKGGEGADVGVALRENLIGLAGMLVSFHWLHAECARNYSWAAASVA